MHVYILKSLIIAYTSLQYMNDLNTSMLKNFFFAIMLEKSKNTNF